MQLPQALSDALQLCRESLVAAFVFSLFANLLNLVPALYMLNVYDKAITSGSVYTLWSLTIFAAAMFGMLFVMEALRGRLLVAISARLDGVVGPELYQRTFINAVNVGGHRASVQPLQDFLGLRQFITGNGIFAIFDAPWLPVYLFVMYLFHPIIGLIGLCAAILLVIIGLINQKKTEPALTRANIFSAQSSAATHRTLRNAEVVEAMGMLPQLQETWSSNQEQLLIHQSAASNSSVFFNALTKTIRLATQSAAIAAGAYLVIKQEISPGMLIAGSLLVGRALQPVEIALGSWKGFVDAKTYYNRICDVLNNIRVPEERMALPPLTGEVSVVNAVLAPPGEAQPTVIYASFKIMGGECACILGPSGAGKSSLMRGLLGLWPTTNGEIRLSGGEASKYLRHEIGPQLGYLPQDIELLEGSVSANICRFGELDSEAIIEASRAAGVHELILSLADGYETRIDQPGGMLSPGQRQRIALARAVYKWPKLVILDEPNSNLDEAGELALIQAMSSLKARGSTIICVTHRQSILPLADKVILMNAGRIVREGPANEILTEIASHQKTA